MANLTDVPGVALKDALKGGCKWQKKCALFHVECVQIVIYI